LETQYNEYIKMIPALAAFSYDQYLWAAMAVGSRIWAYGGNDTALPLLDMMNHGTPEDVRVEWETEGNSFVTYGKIPKGRQVYLWYGDRPQADWLLHYGFTTEKNEAKNCVYLEMVLNPDDPYYEDKKVALNSISELQCDLSLNYDMNSGAAGHLCYAVARTREYDGTNFSLCHEFMDPISFNNEIQALGYIAEISKAALTYFPTSYEEDLKILQNQPDLIKTHFNYYNALIVRTSEKQILHHFIQISTLLHQLQDQLSKIEQTNHTENVNNFLKQSIAPLKSEWLNQYFNRVLPIFISWNSTCLITMLK